PGRGSPPPPWGRITSPARPVRPATGGCTSLDPSRRARTARQPRASRGERTPMSYGQDQSGYGQNAMVPAGGAGLQAPAFSHTTYKVTRPWLSILGRKFYVYAPDGSLTAFVKKPVFKLKQEFTIFA